ncbi:hypothetical protein BRC81_07430 [Halobacteriales archaeon QS_1_68_20]|nr:MAG: hypothetical protein BRC81_07430 [Halobacteriales archaeon QS_1_68_20]
MVLDTIGRILLLSALGVAAGSVAGLVCAPALLSARIQSLCGRLGPTPSLPSNYVVLATLLGVPMVFLHATGIELLAASERQLHDGVGATVRSSLRFTYGLLLSVGALVRLAGHEAATTDFHPHDALALLGLAVVYAVVAVTTLGML